MLHTSCRALMCLLLATVVGAQESKGTVVTLGGLSSRAPADWKPLQATQFRHAEFTLPGADGDRSNAELIVFYFGPGGGGGAEANVARWKGMFQDADAKTEQLTVSGSKVTYLDLTGTYLSRTRPFDTQETPQARPGFRMIAIVFETPSGPYYIRLVGPQQTVARHKKAFDNWLRSFKPAAG
jgi:hypothetical protein